VTSDDLLSFDPHGYDDDLSVSPAIAGGAEGTINVCFRKDLDGVFDDAQVFIARNVPSTSSAVGSFWVELNLFGVAGC
jgi:hypothetical protein